MVRLFSNRSSKPERNDELQNIERQVEKYRDVVQAISKKVSSTALATGVDPVVAKEKRLKKIHEYMLSQAMEESARELPDVNGLLKKILDYCGELEKDLRRAVPITNNE
jgi:hypothetical protein